MVKGLFPDSSTPRYFSFDDLVTLDSARSDPQKFIGKLPDRVIIDEIQRVPELMLPIKYSVDQNRRPGRFFLTGSANVLALPKVADMYLAAGVPRGSLCYTGTLDFSIAQFTRGIFMWTMLQQFLLAGLLVVMLNQACLAHHEEGHNELAVPNSPLMDAILNPQLQLPAPPPSSLVPTDVSSIGGSLGRAQGLEGKLLRPADRTVLDRHWQVRRDDRYSFTGQWLPFSVDNTTADTLSDGSIAQPESKAKISSRREGQVEERVVLLGKEDSQEAVFMATEKAIYTRKSKNELILSNGAILLKTGKKPVYVSLEHHNRKITAQFAGSTISMISLMDAKPIILNLTDKHRGACSLTVYLTGSARSIKIGPGQLAELYAKDTSPSSSAVTSKMLLTQALGDDRIIQIAQYHCIAALKHYNIYKHLSKKDVERVIKTAAALAYTRPL